MEFDESEVAIYSAISHGLPPHMQFSNEETLGSYFLSLQKSLLDVSSGLDDTVGFCLAWCWRDRTELCLCLFRRTDTLLPFVLVQS